MFEMSWWENQGFSHNSRIHVIIQRKCQTKVKQDEVVLFSKGQSSTSCDIIMFLAASLRNWIWSETADYWSSQHVCECQNHQLIGSADSERQLIGPCDPALCQCVYMIVITSFWDGLFPVGTRISRFIWTSSGSGPVQFNLSVPVKLSVFSITDSVGTWVCLHTHIV